MKYSVIFVTCLLLGANADAAECESGWTPYKDELCVKSFPTLLSYHEARDFCAEQGSEIAKASLVLVKEEDVQNLLVNYTNEMFDYVWLGSQYDEEAAEFKWDDGEALTYTNWDETYPRITNASNACVELKPVNAKHSLETGGKWADVNCRKRNMVMCQRTLSWSLQDAINEIIKIRKQHQEDVENLATELGETRAELQTVSSRVIPVGSIYIEYYSQPSPATLWPTLTWEDISSTYAGMFFRATGGGSESWGTTQDECAPRITRVASSYFSQNFPWTMALPANDWSEWIYSGYFDSAGGGTRTSEVRKYFTEGCEVRPRNQAIRIWKRTG